MQQTANPSQLTTIFHKKGERCKTRSNVFLVCALILFATSIIASVISEQPRIAVPGPLMIIFALRYRKNSTAEITFSVQKSPKKDIYFGYTEGNVAHNNEFPVDEYTYWFYEGPSEKGGMKYTLVVMLHNKTQTVYLKEETVMRSAPQGWTRNNGKIENRDGVFLVPGLRDLAAMIDNASVSEEEPAAV